MESKKRILVVDDEQEITLVLRSGLAKHGYDVRVAGEGEAADKVSGRSYWAWKDQ